MNKKAQGLSMNTIVIAALALLVLVILALVFTGKMGDFSSGVRESASCDQACKSAGYTGASTDGDATELIGYNTEDGETCKCK